MNRTAITAASAAALAAAAVVGERRIAAPHYHGPRSDHFDGDQFHNLSPVDHSGGSVLKWMLNRDQGPWREWVDQPAGPRPPARVADLRVTFVNHSTTLIQMNGLNILTDPIWSERCSPFSFVGPRRHRSPGLRFEDLPPIDVVLVSHNHYDHLDLPTLQRLGREHTPRIFTPLGNSALIRRGGIDDARDLDWWQSFQLSSEVKLTVVPAQHFCARAISDRNRTLWGGFVLSGPAGHVYFAGDTGWGDHFDAIARRFGALRLALLPIGAFRPRWFMKPVHIDPAEAVEAHFRLSAATSMAIHFGTFHLGDDGETEPAEVLRAELASRGAPRFWTLGFGEGREVP